jgi:hypothetical protein
LQWRHHWNGPQGKRWSLPLLRCMATAVNKRPTACTSQYCISDWSQKLNQNAINCFQKVFCSAGVLALVTLLKSSTKWKFGIIQHPLCSANITQSDSYLSETLKEVSWVQKLSIVDEMKEGYENGLRPSGSLLPPSQHRGPVSIPEQPMWVGFPLPIVIVLYGNLVGMRQEMYVIFWLESLKGRDHFKEISIDGMIIPKSSWENSDCSFLGCESI